jgi:hypothetical protein
MVATSPEEVDMGELLRAVEGQPSILDAFLRAQEYQRQIGRQEQNLRLQLAQQALARMYRQQELDYQNQRLAMQRANYASEDAWRKANMQREGIAAAAKAYGEALRPNDQYKQNPVIGPPQELTPEQQSPLIGPDPDDIANAYGIPPEAFRQIAQGVLQQNTQAWKDQQAKAKAAEQKAAKLTKLEYETGGNKVTKFIDPDTGKPAIDPDTGNPMVYTAPRQGPPSLSVVPTYVGPDGRPLLLNPKTGQITTGELPPGAAPKPKVDRQTAWAGRFRYWSSQQDLDPESPHFGQNYTPEEAKALADKDMEQFDAATAQPQSAPPPAPQAQPQAAPTQSAPSGPPSNAVHKTINGQDYLVVPLGNGKYRIVGHA